MRVSIAIWIFFLLAGATIPTLAAQRRSANIDERAVTDFYRGKVVRIVVGFPPGGGADVYSRVLARHLGRFIPGRPTLAVTNMPGAGSMIAGNYIYNAGAKDGTEIGMLNAAVILETAIRQSWHSLRYGPLSLPGGPGDRNLRHDRRAPVGHRKIQ